MDKESKPNTVDVTTSDKQYRIMQLPNGSLHALRYDQYWRDLTGDNMVLMLAMDLADAREALKNLCDMANGKFAKDHPYTIVNAEKLLKKP